MATSIGTAWIQIKPSLTGISKDIEKQLSSLGSSSGSSFSKGFGNRFLTESRDCFKAAFSELNTRAENAFSSFAKWATAGVAAAGTAIFSLGKEIDAASGSQRSFEANMKIAGKTNEETVLTFNLLKDYANKSIYSLTDMTSTAGILASTGVKNAGELVKAFGNMAAAADNPAQAIKSISQQMSQVNGKGFIQTMDFRIMQEQASGPMKLVQDELMKLNNWDSLGFQDALSKGKISAEMLNEAMMNVGQNPMLDELATKPGTIGDAWEAFNSTLTSNLATSDAWKNIQKKVIDVISDLTDWISENEETITKWIESVINTGKEVFNWAKENQELVKIISGVILGLKTMQIATGGVSKAVKVLSPIANIAIGSVKGLIGVFQKTTGYIDSVKKPLEETASGLDKVGKSAKNTPKEFTFGKSLSSFLQNIGTTLSGAASGIMAPIKTISSEIGAILKDLLITAGEAVSGFVATFANPNVIIGAVGLAAAAASIATAILLIGSAIGMVTQPLADFMNIIVFPLGNFLLTVVLNVVSQLTNAIILLTNGAIIPLGTFLVESFDGILTTIGNTIVWVSQGAVIPLVDALSGGLTNAINAVSGLFTAAGNAVSGLFTAAGNAISGVVDSIANGISNIINSTANLIRSVGGADWYGTGYGITRNFTAGLIDGIIDLAQDSLNKVINSLLSVPVVGDGLKLIGVKENPINLSGFKLGKRAYGGYIDGIGGPRDDMNPYLLSNGEFVIQAKSVKSIGRANMDYINRTGSLPGFGENKDVVINFGNGAIIVNGADDPEKVANAVWRKVSKKIADAKKGVMA